jgi:hypothetical protein
MHRAVMQLRFSTCLNMHTGQYGLQTVEDIARVKQSIVETSTGAVVVNLDDHTQLPSRQPASQPLSPGFP